MSTLLVLEFMSHVSGGEDVTDGMPPSASADRTRLHVSPTARSLAPSTSAAAPHRRPTATS